MSEYKIMAVALHYPLLSEVIKECFEMAGYKVVTINDCNDLDPIAEGLMGIVMDVNLGFPNEPTIEPAQHAIEILKKYGKQDRVCVVTGCDDAASLARAQIPETKLFTKPFRFEDVLNYFS